MNLNDIWAKSDRTKLVDHTESALKILRNLKFFFSNSIKTEYGDRFWEMLFWAVFFHDIGKCADGFQSQLRDGNCWDYRHEILSASFVSCLQDYNEFEKTAIATTIMAHHKGLQEIREKFGTEIATGKDRFRAKLRELEKNFDAITEFIEMSPEFSKRYLGKELDTINIPNSTGSLVDAYMEFVLPNYIYKIEDGITTSLHGKLGIFLKGLCVACDHLASAKGERILPAIKDMKSVLTHIRNFNYVQTEAMNHKGDAFLIAPTGIGKTEAALLWSDGNQDQNYSRRVYYVLPFTASINAMYKRLIRVFGNEEIVGLKHSKAEYFLYKYLSNDEEFKTETDKSLSDDEKYKMKIDRIKELTSLTEKIYRPYKIVTPFQILKPFFGIRGFEQQLVDMAKALFIFDEIHAYDPHTTALIIEMMKALRENYEPNFLIMSATMPSFLRKIIGSELNITKEICLSKKELSKMRRHRVNVLHGELIERIQEAIKKDLENGKRILIVCNTVRNAQEVYKQLSRSVRNSALLHGRFMLRDREKIEGKLDSLSLLVGTQVVEVSLDISYDALYSEPAPLDALIQRFGRINRRGWEKGNIAEVNVFENETRANKKIYEEELTRRTMDLLSNVDVLDEGTLQELLDEIYREGYRGETAEEFKRTREHFRLCISKNFPYLEDELCETQFYSLFKSYEVVPLQFKIEYLHELEKRRYLEAMKYLVSISEGHFQSLSRNGRTSAENETIFVDTKYSEELGLLMEQNYSDFMI